MVVLKKEETLFTRLTIYKTGSTMTFSASARNLSEAIEEELDHAKARGKEIAQVNIKGED